MHITLESDYAIRIVDCLAIEGTRIGAKAIAEKSRVTLRFSLKILRKLVSSGIARSYKGAQGGYELAKPPEDITLADILETIEGPYHLSRCLKDGHVCEHRCNHECAYNEIFDAVSKIVRDNFRAITVADMICKPPALNASVAEGKSDK